MLLAAMLAVVLVAAAPAVAQVTQEFGLEDVESGGVAPVTEITNSGNNANICPTVLQSGNSGNVQNAQGVVQYKSEADDIGLGGSTITFEVAAEGACTQTIEQAAAAAA